MAYLEEKLKHRAGEVETALHGLLDRGILEPSGNVQEPSRLMAAIRYATLGGGKRIRPYLLLETAAMFGKVGSAVLRAACAIELIHCYSLVHDDLPSMDNDDLRRGRLTLHKAYDEATAILAGDAMLTLAFDYLAEREPEFEAVVQLCLVRELARASGATGMVEGQMLDLAAEGRFTPDGKPQNLDAVAILALQDKKTGALIRCAVRMGAILGGATLFELECLTRYGTHLGLSFQIADDLIDHEGDADIAGKAIAKDAALGKATFVSLLGVEGARDRLKQAISNGIDELAGFGKRAQSLEALIQHMAGRKF